MVAATSSSLRFFVSLPVLSSIPSALAIMPGTLLLSPATRVFSWAVVVVRFDVISSTLCREFSTAGSASSTFRRAIIESSLGSMRSIVGIMSAALPSMPEALPPRMVSPTATRSTGLLASIRFIFTLPSMSLSISAVEPFGSLRFLSRPISATMLPRLP